MAFIRKTLFTGESINEIADRRTVLDELKRLEKNKHHIVIHLTYKCSLCKFVWGFKWIYMDDYIDPKNMEENHIYCIDLKEYRKHVHRSHNPINFNHNVNYHIVYEYTEGYA